MRRFFSLKCFLDAALEFVIEKWNSNNKTKCISEKKKKQNLRVTRTLTSLFLILPSEKTLNTCATQALRYIMEKIEIVICTDTVFSLFLFSWKDSENKQINNRARFLYFIQGQMLKFSTLEEEKKIPSKKKSLSIVFHQALQLLNFINTLVLTLFYGHTKS